MSFINNIFTSDFPSKPRSNKNVLVFLEERFFPFSGLLFYKINSYKDLVENNLL